MRGPAVRVATKVEGPVLQDDRVVGVRTRSEVLRARVVIDATGYRSALLKQAGLDPGMRPLRRGRGIRHVCSALRRAGGGASGRERARARRLRLGVSVGPAPGARGRRHHSSRIRTRSRMRIWMHWSRAPLRYGVNLSGAQPLEHHSGLIPSECFAPAVRRQRNSGRGGCGRAGVVAVGRGHTLGDPRGKDGGRSGGRRRSRRATFRARRLAPSSGNGASVTAPTCGWLTRSINGSRAGTIASGTSAWKC